MKQGSDELRRLPRRADIGGWIDTYGYWALQCGSMTEEWAFPFYLILIYLNLNSGMWLATTTLDSTGLEHRLVALLRVRIYKKMMIKFIFQIGNGKKNMGMV